ncbi:sulfatase-like hydrolase/transferase, partial [bacterium]|nr:sulfatase-like hydrolase/transferase [bacterium]
MTKPSMNPTPNIVLILADDLGYGDLSCLNTESRIHTAHMDRMAEQGMTFTDAHAASSVCTPSRYALLTGRYAWRGRLQRGVLWPHARPLIEPGRLTLPQLLRARGYHTACIGKWHLGLDWPFREPCNTDAVQPGDRENMIRHSQLIDYRLPIRNGPRQYGFDYYFGVDASNFPPYCFIENEHTVGVPDRLKP